MKAMAKNPDDRYGSAEELRADLLRFADGRPVEAGDPGLTSMMTAVGAAAATQAVPMTTGRTTAVPPPETSTTQEDLERKKRTRNLIILLVILLVALAVIAFFLLRSVAGGNVTVPDVSKQSVAAATQTLQNDHLTVGSQRSQASGSVAKGDVVSTDPNAGASVAKNSTVDLVVSSGPTATAVVPTLQGKQLTQAIALLQSANLGYTVHNVTSNQTVGTVLSQNPAGGTKIPETQKVVLTVSGTQTSVSVPSVIGQSPARAGSILQQAGLSVGSQTTASACSTQASGSVSSQNPAAGASEPPNTPINLVVSNGTCVSAPGVVGQSQSAATSAITGAGLVANTTFDSACPNGAQPGNVDSQSPAANAQVFSGSTVNISVCQSATTTTTTTTTTTPSSTTTTAGNASPPGPGNIRPGRGRG
jgi:beta-lactam-binding protein with PASTA domain